MEVEILFFGVGFGGGEKKDCNGQPDPSGCQAAARDTPEINVTIYRCNNVPIFFG
ncbi:MAG: hypothetical protein LBE36_04825 [Flavobacteriaceae bacterium]|jgi:hypothetical protein|nr:hypothetical protein [Flavobacteriaceae bacterium]